MKSMTGFGKSEAKTSAGHYTVELSSVNSRFLEFSFRTPRALSGLENKIREIIQKRLNRGKLNVMVALDHASNNTVQCAFNQQVADAYLKTLGAYQKKRKLSGSVEISDLLSIPEVTRAPVSEINEEALWKALRPAVGKAVDHLLQMREKEGKRLGADLKKRISAITVDLKKIEKLSHNFSKDYKEKLQSRVAELLDGVEINRQRLEEEVALLADRADIAEEITRMKSHLGQFSDSLKSKGSIGKRLNFIVQEMNREVNTIGSKATNIKISNLVIGLKEEIERIREQIQNVE